MHSSEKLAAALRAAGLDKLAERAARHEFHDYLSPHDLPCSKLLMELGKAGAIGLQRRAMEGEFDATKEEGDEWARSPEGQATYAKLLKQKGRPQRG